MPAGLPDVIDLGPNLKPILELDSAGLAALPSANKVVDDDGATHLLLTQRSITSPYFLNQDATVSEDLVLHAGAYGATWISGDFQFMGNANTVAEAPVITIPAGKHLVWQDGRAQSLLGV